jgi:DnaJ-domain-containing protein 1
MDRFFDRLGDLLRSLMGTDSGTGTGFDARDPDMRAALAELDEYLKDGIDARRWRFDEGGGEGPDAQFAARSGRQDTGDAGRRGRSRQQRRAGPRPPESLRRDYGNLEVPFAAPPEEVQNAYRRLMRKYHPDRFSLDPEKQQLATEITKRLNESFQNIRRYEKGTA